MSGKMQYCIPTCLQINIPVLIIFSGFVVNTAIDFYKSPPAGDLGGVYDDATSFDLLIAQNSPQMLQSDPSPWGGRDLR
jgi:hypothetical protein